MDEGLTAGGGGHGEVEGGRSAGRGREAEGRSDHIELFTLGLK